MTRTEHLAWAKQRALEELERGEVIGALVSMLSDLGKHPETQSLRPDGVMLMLDINPKDTQAVRRYIEGFA